jgi:chromosome partitioning protein
MTRRLPKHFRGAVCAVMNEKGGVGKTTTTLHVGVALVELGVRVALIGLDPQRDLTTRFAETMQSDHLAFFDADGRNLKAMIREARKVADFIILDCPPALGPEVAAALAVANTVLVPSQAEAMSLDAIKRLLTTLEAARHSKKRIGGAFTWRLLVTMFDSRIADSFMIEDHLRDQLGNDRVIPGVVARHPAFASAATECKSVFETNPTIRPAATYRRVARSLLSGWNLLEGDTI